MNTRLFKSWWAPATALLCGLMLWWFLTSPTMAGRSPGWRNDRFFLLTTGWVAAALFLVVTLYSLRKYIHRFRWSPEYRLRVTPAALEEVTTRISKIQQEIFAGRLTKDADVMKRAKSAIKATGTDKVVRAQILVEEGQKQVTLQPTEPLGRVSVWMHVHIYLGLMSALVVFLHGGLHWNSPMAIGLNGLCVLVMGSGIFGILTWAFGPNWLAAAEEDLSIEEAYVLHKTLRRQYQQYLSTTIQPLDGGKKLAKMVTRAARKLESRVKVQGDLLALYGQAPESEQEVSDAFVLARQASVLESEYARLRKYKWLLSGWRWVHLPGTIVLSVLVVMHAFSVWWY